MKIIPLILLRVLENPCSEKGLNLFLHPTNPGNNYLNFFFFKLISCIQSDSGEQTPPSSQFFLFLFFTLLFPFHRNGVCLDSQLEIKPSSSWLCSSDPNLLMAARDPAYDAGSVSA